MDIEKEVTAFRKILQAMGLQPQTGTHYSYHVRRFLVWLGRRRRSVRTIRASDVREFLIHLADTRGWASATYNLAFNGLRHFLVQCVKIKEPDLGLSPQRRKPTPKRVLSPASVSEVLSLVVPTRHRTALTVMYGLGLRLNEVCHLRVSDIERGTGMIVISHAKGGGGRRIPLPESVLAVLRRYWQQWRPTDWFFTKDGKPSSRPIAKDAVQRAFRKAKEKSSINCEGSTHLLRHSFACHQVAAGCDLRSLQHVLGHANLNTTLTYLGDLDALQGHRPAMVDVLPALTHFDDLMGGVQ